MDFYVQKIYDFIFLIGKLSNQLYPTFLALETSFVEENFSTVGTGYSLGMIQVHYMYHALYF